MEDWKRDRIGSALRGQNPTVLTRLPGGFAVMGDQQWLPGYCLLLTDDPAARRLSDLPRPQRTAFLQSMSVLAEAVERACQQADPAFRRVNLEILGNVEPFLHAHIWPRYQWEPPELLRRPVWSYPPEKWTDPRGRLSADHDGLRASIAGHLASPGQDA
ncbi:diadenosine tetraphosphate hydrolase [Kineococcus sp. R8]|uniref:HIT family protein n=1 Tax=Kineococcus siccus TaxID=2696567 RepID=UPI00141274D0|nr:HIT domain-containing protein [Kineococcus siccus]NAZ84344.1 diadenosine tetraphosphate hydrolase [Kineococcus siccus]